MVHDVFVLLTVYVFLEANATVQKKASGDLLRPRQFGNPLTKWIYSYRNFTHREMLQYKQTAVECIKTLQVYCMHEQLDYHK